MTTVRIYLWLLFISQDEELARQLVELGYRGSGEVRQIYLFNFLWNVTSNWLWKYSESKKKKKINWQSTCILYYNCRLTSHGFKQLCKGGTYIRGGCFLWIQVYFGNWESRRNFKKITILTQKPQSHVRILILNVVYWRNFASQVEGPITGGLSIKQGGGEGRLIYGMTTVIPEWPSFLNLN